MNTPESSSPPQSLPDDFLAKALASREPARQSGRYIPAAEVIAELEERLARARTKPA